MSRIPPTASLFPSSQAIVTGGNFTIHHNTHVHGMGKGGYDRLLEAVAPNALHDSGHVFDAPKCHPGTRVAVIQAIMSWMKGIDEETDGKPMNWVTGAAGAGKSAIGRSICERCAGEGSFLASFFFGSGDATRNHSRSLVATIAYQLCSISPGIRKAVCEFIEYDPLIFNRSLRTQFSSLVMDPLTAQYSDNSHGTPYLIVIDGLDECLDKASQRDILETLLYVSTASHMPLRILVCSRPETQITNFFDLPRVSAGVFKIFLGDEYSPDQDIRLYLSDRFTDIRQSHNFRTLLPAVWPSQDHINLIVYKSSGQFIFAATVIRYVESNRHQPHQRLEAALGIRPVFKDLPFAELDALYTHILMITEDPFQAANIIAFPAMYDSIPLRDIERYLDLEEGDVQVVLSDLAAIVAISLDGLHEASMYHKSFSDFLFDSQRSKTLYVNRTEIRATHIHMVLQTFSGPGMDAPYHPSILVLNVDNDIRYEDWNQETRSKILDAITHFPMDSLCGNIFSNQTTAFEKTLFLHFFLGILCILEHHEYFRRISHQHMHACFNAAFSELQDTYSSHWEVNCIFSIRFIKELKRVISWRTDNNFAGVLKTLSLGLTPEVKFERLLNSAQRSEILSKAAAHCLTYLCDMQSTKKEAKRHLDTIWMDQRKIKSSPSLWLWRRRATHRVLYNKPIILGKPFGVRGCTLGTYRELNSARNIHHVQIYSLSSFDWTDCDILNGTQMWHSYMSFLEYLPKILPHAGRYHPLIDICQKRSFATMSMMFPALSRRARRAILRYLERMESDNGHRVEA